MIQAMSYELSAISYELRAFIIFYILSGLDYLFKSPQVLLRMVINKSLNLLISILCAFIHLKILYPGHFNAAVNVPV